VISYAVTIYNKARFLPRVLPCLEQEWQATGGEIILVNDGSTDDSAALLDAFAAGRPGIRVIHQSNQGVAAATNAAMAAATQDYIRLVDGDDLLYPGSSTALLQAVKTSGCASAIGDWGSWNLTSPPPGFAPQDWSVRRVEDPLKAALKAQLFVPSSVLLCREDAQAIFPIDSKVRTSQDFAISLRLAVRGPLAKLPGQVCLMGWAEQRLSSSMAVMYSDSLTILLDHWQGWGGAHRRYAVQRNALRAYLYARRHLKLGQAQLLGLQLTRLAAYLPLPMGDGALRRIRASYEEALRSPADYP